jgi:hypothetical protein
MTSIDFINPYQLFGVTEDSSIEKVRKAYYSIALLCHPDKGGHTEYMKTLTLAYKWICDQIVNEKEHRKTFEEYFGKEIKTVNIPNFTDIMVESTGYTKDFFQKICHEVSITDPKVIEQLYIPNFNMIMSVYRSEGSEPSLPTVEEIIRYTHVFLRQYLRAPEDMFSTKVYVPMSIPHGYEFQNLPYKKEIYTKTLIVYKDPLVTPRKTEASLEKKEQLEDYSIDAPIAMNDYQEAFMSYTEDLKKLETMVTMKPFDEALETYRMERSLEDWKL